MVFPNPERPTPNAQRLQFRKGEFASSNETGIGIRTGRRRYNALRRGSAVCGGKCMAHEVFISHSSQDKTAADRVCSFLEAKGMRCWIAPRDIVPGVEW